MFDPLASSKTFFDILKDGAPITNIQNVKVSVLPQGATKADLPGPWQTASYAEQLNQVEEFASVLSALGFDVNLIDYTVTAVWDYNGQYISDFRVNASGSVQVFSSLNISVQTYDADYDEHGVAQMNYDLICILSNLTGGSRRVTISAQARGDGGGMDLDLGDS
jgi:hypothetical protein